MTLDDVAPYDASNIHDVGDRAVVAGGGIAGLLAARVLADAYSKVTIVERDPCPDGPSPRGGTPQSRHVHVLLEAGRSILESLEPGYQQSVEDRGGLTIDAGTDLQYFHHGAYLEPGRAELPMLCASRPLFEDALRDRIRDREAIEWRTDCTVHTFEVDATGSRVTGVSFRTGEGTEESISADLVVDATGRTSRTPRWLERHGYSAPALEEVWIDLSYSSLVVERPSHTTAGYLVVPSPPNRRGGTVVPIEDDRWMVTLFGLHGDHPPNNFEDFLDFAETLPASEPAEVLKSQPVLPEEIHKHPFPANRRYRYDSLADFPNGLLVTGDAIASFNPIYGQGMSVAALDAMHLHHALAGSPQRLAQRYFADVTETIDVIWRMTVGADFGYRETDGTAPLGTGVFNWYLKRLVKTAHDDPYATDAFARVLRLEHAPTQLLAPSLLWRVLSP